MTDNAYESAPVVKKTVMQTVEKLKNLGFEVKEFEIKDNIFLEIFLNYLALKISTGKNY